MANVDFKQALTSTRELEITVTGRRSGQQISLPVWFVHEGDTLYLLPVKGSDSQWYKNILPKPSMVISARGATVTVNPKPITDPRKVQEVVEKFRAKYGAADVQRYYSKFDVAVEVRLDSWTEETCEHAAYLDHRCQLRPGAGIHPSLPGTIAEQNTQTLQGERRQ